jgi:hypothetical protein
LSSLGAFQQADFSPIDWKGFLRIATPLALLVGLFTYYAPPVGALILLPASIFVAIHLYRRRHTFVLRASQGAWLGAVIALLGCVIIAVLAVIGIVNDPVAYRHTSEEQFRQMLASATDPNVKQMLETVVSKVGAAFFVTALEVPFDLGFLLTIGGVSGALAATLPRHRPSP